MSRISAMCCKCFVQFGFVDSHLASLKKDIHKVNQIKSTPFKSRRLLMPVGLFLTISLKKFLVLSLTTASLFNDPEFACFKSHFI